MRIGAADRNTASPWFFVSVASKGLRVYVSGLESTLADILQVLILKKLPGREKDNSRTANLDGVQRRRDRPVPNQLHGGKAQVYLTGNIRSWQQKSREKQGRVKPR